MTTRIIVLAAGKGTRMNSQIPKILIPFEGKPIIRHLLDAVRLSGVDPRPVVIIGYQGDLVRQTLGEKYDYIYQAEQLGTGHAVQSAEPLLAGKAEQIMVFYGDHPFVRSSTIANLRALHEREGCPLSMMTVMLKDFSDWRAPFADFSRIIRDSSGRIVADVQVKDATPTQLNIREVDPAYFCLDAAWLWPHLKLLKNENVKAEYYLTDLVGIAIGEGACIASTQISPVESLGVNTPEHLQIARRLLE